MSKNALEIFPTWMQAYLRETVQNHMLDIAVGVGISIVLLVGVSVTVESSIHEIARLQGK
jgi:hypothetical protein